MKMMFAADDLKKQVRINRRRFDRLFGKLKKMKPRQLDQKFHHLHEEVFNEIDCLQCANCCKTTSPVFTPSDIDRLSRSMAISSELFIEKFLRKDNEDDYVLQGSPCPFLGEDHYCTVYENRPKACRGYPHTNRRKMNQHLGITRKNMKVCPAVYKMMTRMEEMI